MYIGIISCTQTGEKPKDLLSEKEMSEILEEIYLYQQSGYLNELQTVTVDYVKLDAELIQKHGASVEQFQESYKFYILNPEKYNEILEQVRTNLELKLPENERNRRIQERENAAKEK